jgi:DNA-binding NarL/FixJ family response regulator
MASHLQIVPAGAADQASRSSARPIRVVLADDHALMRRSLRLLLERADGVEVLTVADDLAGALRDVNDGLPDVLVLDLRMRDGSSLEAIRDLREHVSYTKVVALTMQDSAEFAQQALDAGACGVVLKAFADDELSQAVRAAARGERFVSPQVNASPTRRLRSGPPLARALEDG